MWDRISISTNKASGVQQQIGLGELTIGIMKWIFLTENGLNLLSKIFLQIILRLYTFEIQRSIFSIDSLISSFIIFKGSASRLDITLQCCGLIPIK